MRAPRSATIAPCVEQIIATGRPRRSTRRVVEARLGRKKEPPTYVRLAAPLRSDHSNVLRFLTFLAGSDIEFDPLTLIQRLEPAALDVREMDKHVIALLTGYEAIALVSVEELHGALCHKYSFLSAADQLLRSARKVNRTPRGRDRPSG